MEVEDMKDMPRSSDDEMALALLRGIKEEIAGLRTAFEDHSRAMTRLAAAAEHYIEQQFHSVR